MCDSLGIKSKPNNGTLRLPLKPIGLHSDKHISTEEDLPDLPTETSPIDNSHTEASKPKFADSPKTDVQAGGTSASNTKPVDPLETDILIDTASPEGEKNQAHVVFQTNGSQTKSNQKRPRKD